jgi:hypothetical protein
MHDKPEGSFQPHPTQRIVGDLRAETDCGMDKGIGLDGVGKLAARRILGRWLYVVSRIDGVVRDTAGAEKSQLP